MAEIKRVQDVKTLDSMSPDKRESHKNTPTPRGPEKTAKMRCQEKKWKKNKRTSENRRHGSDFSEVMLL